MSIFVNELPKKTYFEYGVEKLELLSNILGLNHKTEQIKEIFHSFSSPWGERFIGDASSWVSDVGEDNTPFEFSIAFDEGNPELRILTEVQGLSPNLQSNWEAGIRLNRWLADNFNVSLERFQKIAELYFPNNPETKFSIWHAVCFKPDQEPSFKLYLNPQAQGKSLAPAIIEKSLMRLGLSSAWTLLAEITTRRGSKDEFAYFSLDLTGEEKARVKIYLRHYDATTEDVEKAFSIAPNYIEGNVTEFCQDLADFEDSFAKKPVSCCFSLIEEEKNTFSNVTFHLPISNYVANDGVIKNRICDYFIKHNLPIVPYESTIQAIAQRSLDSGVGIHSYTSLRRDKQQNRVTIYFSLEAHQVDIAKKITAMQAEKVFHSSEEMVLYYDNETIVYHPFLQHLQSEPINTHHLWILFANLNIGISTNFTRRLGKLISRIDDEDIRCILVKQLNDELGNGDPSKIHRKLLLKFMNAIDSWKPVNNEDLLFVGKEFNDILDTIYSDSNTYVGIGATILMEVYGKQFDQFIAKLLRNQTDIDVSSLIWFVLHDELEEDHVDEVLNLARLIPNSKEALEAVCLGAEKVHTASWKLFNNLYKVCFL